PEWLGVYWQKYGQPVLLGLIFVILLIVLIRFRSSSSRERLETATAGIGTGRARIAELRSLAGAPGTPPESVAAGRQNAFIEAERNLSTSLNDLGDSNPKLRAEALIARGDLYWTAANLPALPGAATNPSLQTI